MEIRQRAVRLDLLRPTSWAPESFSPASFERLSTMPDPALRLRRRAGDEGPRSDADQVGDDRSTDRSRRRKCPGQPPALTRTHLSHEPRNSR